MMQYDGASEARLRSPSKVSRSGFKKDALRRFLMEATKATSRRQPSLQCQEGNLAEMTLAEKIRRLKNRERMREFRKRNREMERRDALGAEKGKGKGDGKCRTDSDFDLLKDRMCKAQVSTFVDLMVYQKLA